MTDAFQNWWETNDGLQWYKEYGGHSSYDDARHAWLARDGEIDQLRSRLEQAVAACYEIYHYGGNEWDYLVQPVCYANPDIVAETEKENNP